MESFGFHPVDPVPFEKSLNIIFAHNTNIFAGLVHWHYHKSIMEVLDILDNLWSVKYLWWRKIARQLFQYQFDFLKDKRVFQL